MYKVFFLYVCSFKIQELHNHKKIDVVRSFVLATESLKIQICVP